MAYTTIDKPEDYFNTVLYTGNGSTQSITGVGFQPDWVWLKGRSVAAGGNLSDSVRGVNKQLQSAGTFAEETLTTCLTSFDSDGFSLGSNGNVNGNTNTYVAWNWYTGATASSNTDGTITSSVSANTTAGFSIVSYTSNGSASQTVGHGLGAVPHMIIAKNRDSSSSSYNYWTVYHHSLPTANDKKLKLNESEAASSTNLWGDADPTTTKFYVHTSGDGSTNVSTDKIIAYCFTGIKGYSKFGSYTGNGNADGTFVYTGFKPAFIMLKPTSTTGNWFILDNKRSSFNVMDKYIRANQSSAEATFSMMDFVSNGVKIITSDSSINGSGVSYIYMCFAESPFVSSGGIPCTAR